MYSENIHISAILSYKFAAQRWTEEREYSICVFVRHRLSPIEKFVYYFEEQHNSNERHEEGCVGGPRF